ncbi:hypothetical protein ACH40E_30415 [Streptomyces acidicola]
MTDRLRGLFGAQYGRVKIAVSVVLALLVIATGLLIELGVLE